MAIQTGRCNSVNGDQDSLCVTVPSPAKVKRHSNLCKITFLRSVKGYRVKKQYHRSGFPFSG